MYIALILLVLIALYGVSMYNKLVRSRSLVEEGWSGIDVQLKKRYNLIPNLVETVKGVAAHEKDTLNQVVEARNKAQNAQGAHDKAVAEGNLQSALANVFALSEAYPEIKSNTNFLQLQNELSDIEGDVEKARRYYNGTVRENNIMVESFPSSLLAGAFNFDLAEYFELEDKTQRQAPEVKF